jgi:hypothetical protein
MDILSKTTEQTRNQTVVNRTSISMKTFLPHKNGGFDCYFKTAVQPLVFCFGA